MHLCAVVAMKRQVNLAKQSSLPDENRAVARVASAAWVLQACLTPGFILIVVYEPSPIRFSTGGVLCVVCV
jgi:hypothetical protein